MKWTIDPRLPLQWIALVWAEWTVICGVTWNWPHKLLLQVGCTFLRLTRSCFNPAVCKVNQTKHWIKWDVAFHRSYAYTSVDSISSFKCGSTCTERWSHQSIEDTMTSPENNQDEVYKIPPTFHIQAIINLNNFPFFFWPQMFIHCTNPDSISRSKHKYISFWSDAIIN